MEDVQMPSMYSSMTNYASSVASSAMSFVGGALIGAKTMSFSLGGALGLLSNTVDEYLISQGLLTQHRLTTSAFWASTVTYPLIHFFCPGLSSPVSFIANAVASISLSYLNTDFLDFRQKLETPIISFNAINQMFDLHEVISLKELKILLELCLTEPASVLKRLRFDLDQLSQNQFFINFIKVLGISLSKAFFEALFIYVLGTYSNSLFPVNLYSRFELSAIQNLQLDNRYVKEVVKILGLFLAKALVELGLDRIENHVSRDQYQTVLEKSTQLLLENGNGRKILASAEGRILVRNLRPDLTKLMYRGSNRLNYVFAECSNALISLGTLSTLASDALAPYIFLVLPYQLFLQWLEQSSRHVAEELSEADMELWEVITDISSNIEEINLRGGEAFIEDKFESSIHRHSALEKKKEDDILNKKGLEKVKTTFSFFLDALYYRQKLLSRSIQLAQIPLVHKSVQTVYDFISSNLNLQITGKELELAQKRVSRLFDILQNSKPIQAKHTTNDQGKIIFKDYVLRVNEDEIVQLNFEFLPHHCYAITGKSGAGKTSTLIDLKQGVLGDLNSSGEISVGLIEGREPKVLFVDQHLYFPVNTPLIEVLAFPDVYSKKSEVEKEVFKEKAISLLKRLEIDSFADQGQDHLGVLSHLEDKEFKLSGGQQKKVALVQAILNHPDILILDETFTGLDLKSLQVAQTLLKEELPKTTLLVIDHHAEQNNYNGFYHSKVHFENGSAQEQEIVAQAENHGGVDLITAG